MGVQWIYGLDRLRSLLADRQAREGPACGLEFVDPPQSPFLPGYTTGRHSPYGEVGFQFGAKHQQPIAMHPQVSQADRRLHGESIEAAMHGLRVCCNCMHSPKPITPDSIQHEVVDACTQARIHAHITDDQ